MVIGLEQRCSDYAEKIKFFKNRYSNCFLRLIQTVHPYALAGEIPGAASNVNWALRQSTAIMRDAGLPLDPERTILTKLDTDTLFLPTFLETLEREFLDLDEAKRRDTVFQSILTYNLALDQRYFFTRVTGILRTFFNVWFVDTSQHQSHVGLQYFPLTGSPKWILAASLPDGGHECGAEPHGWDRQERSYLSSASPHDFGSSHFGSSILAQAQAQAQASLESPSVCMCA